MDTIPQIFFRVERDDRGSAWGEILVRVGRQTLFHHPNYPLTALARQLAAWSARVTDDMHAACFVFNLPEHPDLLGTFRIEPRPVGWQFTSMSERRTHEEMLPLERFKQMSERFCHELRPA